VTAAVGDPDIAFGIDMDAVRAIPEDAFTERAQKLSVFVELDNRLRIDPISRPADHPQMSFRVEFQIAREAHHCALGEGQAVRNGRIVERGPFLHDEQVLFVGTRPLRIRRRTGEQSQENNGQSSHVFSPRECRSVLYSPP
jgi:hypothetical protein